MFVFLDWRWEDYTCVFILWHIGPLLGKDLEANTDNSRCYPTAREEHLYNNRATAGNGGVLKTIGATQLVVSCELSFAREALKILSERLKLKNLHC
jgi:hypothetical protein